MYFLPLTLLMIHKKEDISSHRTLPAFPAEGSWYATLKYDLESKPWKASRAARSRCWWRRMLLPGVWIYLTLTMSSTTPSRSPSRTMYTGQLERALNNCHVFYRFVIRMIMGNGKIFFRLYGLVVKKKKLRGGKKGKEKVAS